MRQFVMTCSLLWIIFHNNSGLIHPQIKFTMIKVIILTVFSQVILSVCRKVIFHAANELSDLTARFIQENATGCSCIFPMRTNTVEALQITSYVR